MLSRPVSRWCALACASSIALLSPTTLTVAAKKETLKPPKGALLHGVVRDAKGEAALAGARVVLTPMAGKGEPRSEITDASGKYAFEKLPHGLFEIAFEHEGQAYIGNRTLMIAPGREHEANFRLGPFEVRDELAGLTPGQKTPGLESGAGGVARLEERVGPTGLAWFRTGKGVAVLVLGGALAVAGVIALADSNPTQNPSVSPSQP